MNNEKTLENLQFFIKYGLTVCALETATIIAHRAFLDHPELTDAGCKE